MNTTARRKESFESATVIPLHRDRSDLETSDSSGFSSLVLSEFPGLTEIKDELKSVIESRITEFYLRSLLSVRRTADDPFDAIYLSRLTPDVFSRDDVSRIVAFSTIRDLSEELDFDDEWSL